MIKIDECNSINCILIYNLQRSRVINDPPTQKEQKNNHRGSKQRPAAVKISKVVNCPLCPVRASSDIFLLDHFCKRHKAREEESNRECPVCSTSRQEALQRIRHLFNKYSHKRETHRDWLRFAKQMGKVCSMYGTNNGINIVY